MAMAVKLSWTTASRKPCRYFNASHESISGTPESIADPKWYLLRADSDWVNRRVIRNDLVGEFQRLESDGCLARKLSWTQGDK